MTINKIKTSLLVAAITLFTVTANAQISKAAISATGLTCSMCSNAINKQLKTIPNVQNVDVDLNTNTFIVTMNDGNSITPLIFKQKVEDAGFFIGQLELTMASETAKTQPYIIVENGAVKDGVLKVKVLDEGYVTAKEFKKLSKSYKNLPSYNSKNEGDFHIKMLN